MQNFSTIIGVVELHQNGCSYNPSLQRYTLFAAVEWKLKHSRRKRTQRDLQQILQWRHCDETRVNLDVA